MVRSSSVFQYDGERPADLLFWFGNGSLGGHKARVKADIEVSIGRTDSKRALGFVVTNGADSFDFVLNRDQVIELTTFLQIQVGRLRKPVGRKPHQLSFVGLAEMEEKAAKAAARRRKRKAVR